MAEKEEKKELGITVKKDKDFSEWYQQVILKSDLADYSLVGGCIVFRPYSYAIWEKVVKAVDDRLKAMGVKNAYFPLLIPEKLLKKEAAHLKGFSPEVAWVDYAGGTKLEERLAVRPTSETIMYDSYSKWIRSWRDLPLKINQWNSVVRWEFKHAVPFLRTREFLWNEGHTVFADKKEAEKECIDILNMYREILEEYFALYNLPGKKTDKEKFAGAEYTFSLEIYMPNGRAIQGPDSHHDGENFAKAFNIKFLDKDGKEKFAIQNTWAITTRMLGVLFAVHGDDKGLILPPKLAPIQIVIVPIFFKESEKVMKKAEEIKSKLRDFSVELDAREEVTPGYKFNEWELKGIPIRIEIGPKDLEKDQVILVRRDSGKKEAVKIAELGKKIKATLDDIQSSLFQKSKKLTEDNIVKTDKWNDLTKAIENKKLVLAPSCGIPECEDYIKDKTGGAKALNIPFDQPKSIGKCIHCGKEGKYWVYFGKSY